MNSWLEMGGAGGGYELPPSAAIRRSLTEARGGALRRHRPEVSQMAADMNARRPDSRLAQLRDKEVPDSVAVSCGTQADDGFRPKLADCPRVAQQVARLGVMTVAYLRVAGMKGRPI